MGYTVLIYKIRKNYTKFACIEILQCSDALYFKWVTADSLTAYINIYNVVNNTNKKKIKSLFN